MTDRLARVDAVLLSKLTARHAPHSHRTMTVCICETHAKYPPGATDLVRAVTACPHCRVEYTDEDRCSTCDVTWPCPDADDLVSAGVDFSPRR